MLWGVAVGAATEGGHSCPPAGQLARGWTGGCPEPFRPPFHEAAGEVFSGRHRRALGGRLQSQGGSFSFLAMATMMMLRRFFAAVVLGGVWLLPPGGLALAGDAVPAPPPPRWWGEGEVARVTEAKGDEVATLGQGRVMAKGALAALREVIPKLGDAVEGDLVGKDKAVPGWGKPKADSEAAQALAGPLTRGQLKGLARPFYDRLHDYAPDWLGLRLQENGADQAGGRRYPWGEGDGNDGAPVKVGELKAVFALDFAADNEKEPVTDGIPDLWEYGVVHADPTGKWRDIGGITLANAAQIGAKSAAGPPPKTFALHVAGQVDRRLAGKKPAEAMAMFLDYQPNGKA
ncbi:MAG: hypothetical protein JWO82_4383, partial [Akkermansiaceae bacterium]|nr:hypothetical protein [Akkermansiaceae bacterium]